MESAVQLEKCLFGVCASPEWWMVWVTVSLCVVTLVLAVFTAKLYVATVGLGQAAERTSTRQAQEMNSSIAEATRAASAMAKIAEYMEVSSSAANRSVETLRERTALQLRAYLVADAGTSVYQDRVKKVGFQAQAKVTNSGNSPALRVRVRTNSRIVPNPLPPGFEYELPDFLDENGMSLASGKTMDIWSEPLDLVPDKDVAAIKSASGQVLLFWGQLSYEDVLGEKHETSFCHAIYWRGQAPQEQAYAVFQRAFDKIT